MPGGSVLGFVVELAVAEPLVVGIGNLIPELLTDTFCGVRDLQLAVAVAALALHSLSDFGNDFLIFIQTNSHDGVLLSWSLPIGYPRATSNTIMTENPTNVKRAIQSLFS